MSETFFGKTTIQLNNTPIGVATTKFTLDSINKSIADAVDTYKYTDTETERRDLTFTMSEKMDEFFDSWLKLCNEKPARDPCVVKVISVRSMRRGAEATIMMGTLLLKLQARSLRTLRVRIKPILGHELRLTSVDEIHDQENNVFTFDFSFDAK